MPTKSWFIFDADGLAGGAMYCNSTLLNTDGGAARNEHCQIVDPDGEPIPGLYGVGEFGSFWGHHYQGSGNVGECLVLGRIAARHILSQK